MTVGRPIDIAHTDGIHEITKLEVESNVEKFMVERRSRLTISETPAQEYFREDSSVSTEAPESSKSFSDPSPALRGSNSTRRITLENDAFDSVKVEDFVLSPHQMDLGSRSELSSTVLGPKRCSCPFRNRKLSFLLLFAANIS